MHKILVSLLVFAIAGVGVLSQPAGAAFPGANGKIAFSSDRGGASQIWAMNSDGTNPTIVTGLGHDVWPSWSADGTKIALQGAPIWSISVVNQDGSGRTQLPSGTGPAWSPDGSKIAFEQGADIVTMDIDGTNKNILTNPLDAIELAPTWSSANRIAFASNDDIYTMDPDGGNVTNLTNSLLADETQPDWSPSGSQIAFATNQDGNFQIYVMDADGNNLVRLTENSSSDVAPVWSPDGTKISFMSDRDGNDEIYVMNADGSGQTNLTNNPAADSGPDWQPLVDFDADGCFDSQELGSDPLFGGQRAPDSFWDFYDVYTGSPAARDRAVSIGDVGAVVARFGATREPVPTKENALAEALTVPMSAPAYHAAFDRGGPLPGQNLWNLLPPDGSINIVDIGSVVAQFGHSCV